MVPQKKDDPTGIVISAYYRVDPDDRQKFIDAVVPHLALTAAQPGCVYYVFAQDLTDPNTIHLSEGWRDQAALDLHNDDEVFLKAAREVVSTVRILDYQAQYYDVAAQHGGTPPGDAASSH